MSYDKKGSNYNYICYRCKDIIDRNFVSIQYESTQIYTLFANSGKV